MSSGGQKSFASLRRQPLVVDAVQPVGVDVALEALHVMDVVRQHHDAALGEHDVVVQLLAEPFPQLERMVVEPGALVVEVVRADDGGVAACVAAAEPALLDHRDVGDAVFLGEIVGGAEPVAAGADDDDVVFGLRLGVRPLLAASSCYRSARCVRSDKNGKMGHRRIPMFEFRCAAICVIFQPWTVWMRQSMYRYDSVFAGGKCGGHGRRADPAGSRGGLRIPLSSASSLPGRFTLCAFAQFRRCAAARGRRG